MKGKRPRPYCPMAHALVARSASAGRSWIVRELMHAPRRYTDLVERPARDRHQHPRGAAPRTSDLRRGRGRRSCRRPYASTVYELTPYGRELQRMLYALGRRGARSLGPPQFDAELYPEWGLNAFLALYDPTAGNGFGWHLRPPHRRRRLHRSPGRRALAHRGRRGRGRGPRRCDEHGHVLRARVRRELEPARALRKRLVRLAAGDVDTAGGLLRRVQLHAACPRDRLMGDAMGSSPPGRGLARLGRRGGRSAMLVASVSGRRGEAQARWRPAPPAATGPERPRRVRSCIRTHEIVASTI